MPDDQVRHCVDKIVEIVECGELSRRSLLQLGYNLGRLSELTGLGREAFWDRWKEPVDAWDLAILRKSAEGLQASLLGIKFDEES